MFLFQRMVKQHRILDFYLSRSKMNFSEMTVASQKLNKTVSYVLFKLITLPNSSSQYSSIPYSFPSPIRLRLFKSRVLSDWYIFEIVNVYRFRYCLEKNLLYDFQTATSILVKDISDNFEIY